MSYKHNPQLAESADLNAMEWEILTLQLRSQKDVQVFAFTYFDDQLGKVYLLHPAMMHPHSYSEFDDAEIDMMGAVEYITAGMCEFCPWSELAVSVFDQSDILYAMPVSKTCTQAYKDFVEESVESHRELQEVLAQMFCDDRDQNNSKSIPIMVSGDVDIKSSSTPSTVLH